MHPVPFASCSTVGLNGPILLHPSNLLQVGGGLFALAYSPEVRLSSTTGPLALVPQQHQGNAGENCGGHMGFLNIRSENPTSEVRVLLGQSSIT